MQDSIWYGILLSISNAILAIISHIISFKLNNRGSMRLIFGSMSIRVLFIALAVYLIFRYTDLEKVEFSIAFVISTFILIFVEILLINNRSNLLNLKKNK